MRLDVGGGGAGDSDDIAAAEVDRGVAASLSYHGRRLGQVGVDIDDVALRRGEVGDGVGAAVGAEQEDVGAGSAGQDVVAVAAVQGVVAAVAD